MSTIHPLPATKRPRTVSKAKAGPQLVSPTNINATRNSQMIEHLRDMLALAERGEITGLAIAAWATDRKSHMLGVSGALQENLRDSYWLLGLFQTRLLERELS